MYPHCANSRAPRASPASRVKSPQILTISQNRAPVFFDSRRTTRQRILREPSGIELPCHTVQRPGIAEIGPLVQPYHLTPGKLPVNCLFAQSTPMQTETNPTL